MVNPPHLMMIELNEFNADYLLEMSRLLKLSNLQRVFSYQHSITATADLVEHQGLDPWVQWVGVHCGAPTRVHGIRRLGNTRGQTLPQIWHAVAEHGYTWGTWGLMNAPFGNPKGCCFFMPDPWSFDEVAWPHNLNYLLALPRYIAKNYLECDFKRVFAAALRTALFFALPGQWPMLRRLGEQCFKAAIRTGISLHTLTTLADYVNVLCFIGLRSKLNPNLSILFLNHIAHLQHQFWHVRESLHPEMRLGLVLSDAMIGLLLANRRNDEAFLLMNGLKQKNVAGQGNFVYRQRNPQTAVEAMGIERGRVEQCMTHDANILFTDSGDADKAYDILDHCHLSDGHKAFYVERQAPVCLFYQLLFQHKVAPGTTLVSGNYSQPFDAVFQLVCERTGAHVPEGDIFASGIYIPARIQNHKVFALILDYFRNSGHVRM
jgi:hypothetical protein